MARKIPNLINNTPGYGGYNMYTPGMSYNDVKFGAPTGSPYLDSLTVPTNGLSSAGADMYAQLTGAPAKTKGAGILQGLGAKNVGSKLGNASNMFGNFSLQGISDYAKGVNQSYQAATGNPLWSRAGGIDKLGSLANMAGFLTHGGNAISGFYNNSQQESNLNDLMSDIESSAYSNPLADSYLTADQRRTLRDIQKDRFDDPSMSDAWTGVIKGVPKALLSAVGGYLTGGIPGAAIQGIGTLVNSGVQGYGNAIQSKDAELQALYETLASAEQDYNSMRRPANLRGSGLSSRAYNSLY